MKTRHSPPQHKAPDKEQGKELKTIHDLPKEIKEMYEITDEHESINKPVFIGLLGKEYTITNNGTTYRIERSNKCIIHLWVEKTYIHITVL